ncbi:MAG: hypothetical protein QXF82_00115 [Nitrososphaeria archaeon]
MLLLKVFARGNIKILNKILGRYTSKEFDVAIKYLGDKYGLADVMSCNVYTNIVLFSLIILILFLVISLEIFKNPFHAVPISIMISLISYMVMYYSIIGEYERDKFILSTYYCLMFKEITLAYDSTKSILESIRFVASGNYPIISIIFEKIVQNIINGLEPEHVLTSIPYESICLRLKKIFSWIKLKSTRDFLLEKEELNGYEKLLPKIEAYCLILISFGAFMPIIYSFIMIYMKMVIPIMILELALLQIVFLTFLSRLISSNLSIVIGEKNEKEQ